MNLYFAGAQTPMIDEYIYNLGANRLYSYFSEKKHIDRYIELLKRGATSSKMIVDSGAFSAWTRGVTIDVDAYIDWLNERSDYIEAAGQMDIIPGDKNSVVTSFQESVDAAQGTWDNYLYMRERLKNPDILLYTFHIGEPIEFLKQALEWRDPNGNKIKYMALGGMVGKPRPVRENFLSSCFAAIHASSNPDVHIHAFGMTDLNLCNKFPIYSADSTTWIIHGAQGRIRDNLGKYIIISDQQKTNLDHFLNLNPKVQKKLLKLFEDNGFTYEQLKGGYEYRLLFNMRMMHQQFQTVDNNTGKKHRKPSFFS